MNQLPFIGKEKKQDFGEKRRKRFGILEMLALLLVLGGGLFFALHLVLQTRAVVATPVESAPPSLHPDILWNEYHMIDAQVGWGRISKLAQSPSSLFSMEYIVRTTDGGQHWLDVSPPHRQWQSWQDEAFVSSTVAWGLASPDLQGQTGQVQVLHTIDGGTHWTATPLPVPFTQQSSLLIAASGAQSCWVVIAHTLFRTSNGGQHWSVLPFPDNAGSIGSSDLTSLTFLNATAGWAVVANNTSGAPLLYLTRDGGLTWQAQDLQLPSSNAVEIQAPIFFNARQGVLPVSLNANSVRFYQTVDTGLHWTHTTSDVAVPASGDSELVSAVLSPQRWLVYDEITTYHQVDGSFSYSMALYETQDSGQSWQTVSPHVGFHSLGVFDFPTPTSGWAIGNNMPWSYPAGAFSDTLLRSTDGGQSWQEAHYTIIWQPALPEQPR